MGKAGTAGPHSGEGLPIAERVKTGGTCLLWPDGAVRKKFRYQEFKIYIRATLCIFLGRLRLESAEYWPLEVRFQAGLRQLSGKKWPEFCDLRHFYLWFKEHYQDPTSPIFKQSTE